MANVVPIFVAYVQSLLHQDNIGITYVGTSNFKMELVTYVPLYFVAMPQSIIIGTQVPFVSTPTNNVVGIRSKPHTPRGTKFMSLHEDMPWEANNCFAN